MRIERRRGLRAGVGGHPCTHAKSDTRTANEKSAPSARGRDSGGAAAACGRRGHFRRATLSSDFGRTAGAVTAAALYAARRNGFAPLSATVLSCVAPTSWHEVAAHVVNLAWNGLSGLERRPKLSASPAGNGPGRENRRSLVDNWYGGIGPRLGFSYALDSKTSIRGAATRSFGPLVGWGNTSHNIGFVVRLTNSDTSQGLSPLWVLKDGAPAWAMPPNIDPSAGNGASAPYYNGNVASRGSGELNYSFNIQRQLASQLMWEIGYVGVRGVKLPLHRWFNQPDRLTGIRPNPLLIPGGYYVDNSENSNYNSLQTSIRKRFSRHFSFDLNYTWGKTMAYMYGDITYAIPTFIQDFFDVKSNRGRPPTDVQHTLVGDFVYDIPLLSGARRAFLLAAGCQRLLKMTIVGKDESLGNQCAGMVGLMPDYLFQQLRCFREKFFLKQFPGSKK